MQRHPKGVVHQLDGGGANGEVEEMRRHLVTQHSHARKAVGRSVARKRIPYPLRVGQRDSTNGGKPVVYRSGYSGDPRDWNWVEWAFFLGAVIIFGIILAGFIVLLIDRNRCCL